MAVFVADEQMRYVAVNAYACSVLGYTREALLELRVTDVARQADAGERYADMVTDGTQRGEIVLTASDGHELAAEYFAQQTKVAGMTFFVSVVVLRGAD